MHVTIGECYRYTWHIMNQTYTCICVLHTWCICVFTCPGSDIHDSAYTVCIQGHAHYCVMRSGLPGEANNASLPLELQCDLECLQAASNLATKQFSESREERPTDNGSRSAKPSQLFASRCKLVSCDRPFEDLLSPRG